MPRRRPGAADAPAPAVHPWRLQLPAPGPVRGARVPPPGRLPAFQARSRLHGRRVRADRAAAADAVAGRGRPVGPGAGRHLPRPPPAGDRHPRRLPGQHASRRQPHPLGEAIHDRDHLSRREVAAVLADPAGLTWNVSARARRGVMPMHDTPTVGQPVPGERSCSPVPASQTSDLTPQSLTAERPERPPVLAGEHRHCKRVARPEPREVSA